MYFLLYIFGAKYEICKHIQILQIIFPILGWNIQPHIQILQISFFSFNFRVIWIIQVRFHFFLCIFSPLILMQSIKLSSQILQMSYFFYFGVRYEIYKHIQILQINFFLLILGKNIKNKTNSTNFRCFYFLFFLLLNMKCISMFKCLILLLFFYILG